MTPVSPLDYLAAFALSFIGGALFAMYHCRHAGKVCGHACVHA